ncbi:MAG TPA: glycosyltransferase family 4 protein, partial [Jatrophihabitans sp.]|nr:glycosyltransferase family 4 protein [Jatrophihabitans sp.]
MPNTAIRDALASVARRVSGRQWRAQSPDTHRIYFLMVTSDGIGGVARAVLAIASALAEEHEVEIISVYRRRDRPTFPVDPRVRITFLDDQRRPGPAGPKGGKFARASRNPQRSKQAALLDKVTSRIFPDEPDLSLLTDIKLARHLPKLAPGVLISVRPALHAAALMFAPPHLMTIAQDHLSFPVRMRKECMREVMGEVVSRFDGLAALTESDAADYRIKYPPGRAVITNIPNPSPFDPVPTPPALDTKIIISAGRLETYKGFDRLIDAFAPVAQKHPDWQVHIYGQGPERRALRRQIAERGLQERVILKGFTPEFAEALSEGSFYAMASRFEAFPMVLLEAMSRGLPVVSYDGARGAGHIVDEGRNGRLIPDDDQAAYTEALLQLIEDDALRARMSAEALADVESYTGKAVSAKWDELFAQIMQRRRS